MGENKMEIYGKCPTRKCNKISGFSLPKQAIEDDDEYFCQECKKESKLSIWNKSTQEAFEKQEGIVN